MPSAAKNARNNDLPGAPPSSHAGCAVGDLFAMLGKPHMLGLLHAFCAASGPIRFRDLEAQLRIPPKTLSQRLRTLVERGFLARQAYSEIPPRVEYAPTRKLMELLPLFAALDTWAKENTMTATPVVSVVGAVPPARGARASA